MSSFDVQSEAHNDALDFLNRVSFSHLAIHTELNNSKFREDEARFNSWHEAVAFEREYQRILRATLKDKS
jgi:hypothetical protein